MEADDGARSAVARLRALREHRRRATGRLVVGDIHHADIPRPENAVLPQPIPDEPGLSVTISAFAEGRRLQSLDDLDGAMNAFMQVAPTDQNYPMACAAINVLRNRMMPREVQRRLSPGEIYPPNDPGLVIQMTSVTTHESQTEPDPQVASRLLFTEAIKGLLSGDHRDRAIWDHEWLRGHLHEICPGRADSMEANLFVLASSERIPPALLECDGPIPLGLAMDHHVARLVQKFGSAEERASWVVHAWAEALNLIERPSGLVEPASRSVVAGVDPEDVQPRGTYAGPPLTRMIVDQSGHGHFRSIGEALEHAPSGGTIKVMAGTYSERFMVTRAVSIVGSDDRGEVIITSTQPYVIAVDELAWMKLEKVTVRMTESPTSGGAAVTVISGEVTVDDCEISSVSGDGVNAIGKHTSVTVRNSVLNGSGVYGVRGRESARLSVENCTILYSGSAGIVVKDMAHLTVKETQIMGGKQNGILAVDHADGLVENCVIQQNGASGVSVATGASLVVTNCNIASNFRGIMLSQSGTATVTSCVLEKNARNWLIEEGARFTGHDNVPPS